MAANTPLSKLGGGRASQALNGRRAPLIVAAVAAVLAAVLIYVYVSHQNNSATPAAVAPQQAKVFVATAYIPAGTSGAQIAADGLLKPETIAQTQAMPGAIYDPSQITAATTTTAINPNSQVTTTQFNMSAKPTIPSALKGTDRGVAFAMNAPQALGTTLATGDYVDVMLLLDKGRANAGATSELVATNIEVLSVAGGQVFLRVSDKQALLLTAATNAGTLWLDYRPFHGAKQTMKIGNEETIK